VRNLSALVFVKKAKPKFHRKPSLQYWNEDNIPIDVQFAGRFGDEAILFRLAAQLEQGRPWTNKNRPFIAITSYKKLPWPMVF